MDLRATDYLNVSIAGDTRTGLDAGGFQDRQIVAIAICARRLVGFGQIGRDPTEQADFLDEIAKGAGRSCLRISDGPETNAIDDPVFFRGPDYEIVRNKGIGLFGQAEGLDRLGGGGPIKNEDLRGNIRGESSAGSAGKDECEKLQRGINVNWHYRRGAVPVDRNHC